MVSNWRGAEIKLVNPSYGLPKDEIFKCLDLCGGMCKIEYNGEPYQLRQDRFELIAKVKQPRKKSKSMTEKSQFNADLKLEAVNDGKEWDDKELEEIFLSNIPYPIPEFPNDRVVEFASKFKRTYFAVEANIRVCDEYLKTGEIREFYYNRGELTKTGEQIKQIIDRLLLENKLSKRHA
ncbi:MAG: hypothetical protein ACFFG0_10495 [Candidatus Thorarchaeota archaeon]